jgi:hypothetical protein
MTTAATTLCLRTNGRADDGFRGLGGTGDTLTDGARSGGLGASGAIASAGAAGSATTGAASSDSGAADRTRRDPDSHDWI